MNTDIRRQMTSDGPMADIDDAGPITKIRKGDTSHIFFITAPYASAYNINAGFFSWSVNLNVIAVDGGNKLIEAGGVSALVYLDSRDGAHPNRRDRDITRYTSQPAFG